MVFGEAIQTQSQTGQTITGYAVFKLSCSNGEIYVTLLLNGKEFNPEEYGLPDSIWVIVRPSALKKAKYNYIVPFDYYQSFNLEAEGNAVVKKVYDEDNEMYVTQVVIGE